MGSKMGLLIGFGAGYYFGAKAGRERFEELDRVLTNVKDSEAVDVATEKAKAVIDLGVERAKDVIESRKATPADRRSVAVEVVAQLLAAVGVAELGQRLGLDLADALAGDAELPPDLLERAGLAVVEPEAQPHDLLLALVQLVRAPRSRRRPASCGPPSRPAPRPAGPR